MEETKKTKKIKILHYDGGNTPDFTIYWNWAHVQVGLGLSDEEMTELQGGECSTGDNYWVFREDQKLYTHDATKDTQESDFPEKDFGGLDEDEG